MTNNFDRYPACVNSRNTDTKEANIRRPITTHDDMYFYWLKKTTVWMNE